MSVNVDLKWCIRCKDGVRGSLMQELFETWKDEEKNNRIYVKSGECVVPA